MAQAAPQTIHSELRSQAWRLLVGANATAFDLKRLSAEAEKLSKADAMAAIEVKATVAALSGDYSTSETLFERLVSLSSEPHFLQRYIQVMALSGEVFAFKRAYDKHLKNEVLPNDWKREICQLLGLSGWLRESVRLQQELEEEGCEVCPPTLEGLIYPEAGDDKDPTQDGFGIPVYETERNSADVLEAADVEERALPELMSRSIRFLRGRAMSLTAVRTLHVVHEDGTGGLLVSFIIKSDMATAADAEWDLFAEFAEDVPGPMLDGSIAVGVLARHGEAYAD